MTFDNAIYNAAFVPIRYARKMAKGSKDMDNSRNWAGVHPSWHFDYKKGSGLANDSRYIFFKNKWREGINLARKHIKGSGLVFVVDANYQYDKADDEQGNRETKTDTTPPPAGQAGTTNYTYDDANQLTSESRPGGEAITYTYDENGNTGRGHPLKGTLSSDSVN